jgi:hypothetical protein
MCVNSWNLHAGNIIKKHQLVPWGSKFAIIEVFTTAQQGFENILKQFNFCPVSWLARYPYSCYLIHLIFLVTLELGIISIL